MLIEYTLPGDGVGPEGITEDPDGVTFYVSSCHQGTVFRGRIDQPVAEPWLPAGGDGRTACLGMAVDARRRLLVCGADTGRFFCYDTETGELLGQRTVPSTPTLLNDTCVVGDFAYVTDSLRPVVWRFPLADGLGEPEEWIDLTRFGADPGVLHYLNGIVPADGGSCLVVAAQGTGVLWRIETATATAAQIELEDGESVNGDGLLWVGEVLYACDNSEEPDGTVRMWLTALRLAEDARSGEVLGRWERPLADSPTTAALVGGRILVVNSQFGRRHVGEPARPPFTVSALTPPV